MFVSLICRADAVRTIVTKIGCLDYKSLFLIKQMLRNYNALYLVL